MNQDGYTLAETLAALVMIGLAVGGLSAGVRVIGLGQTAATRHAATARDVASLQRSLSGLLKGQGPFQSDDATGLSADAHRFRFACRAGICGAEITADGKLEKVELTTGAAREAVGLPAASQASFAYVGTRTVGDVWPPRAETPATNEPETLKAILVLAGQNREPVATVRLWREHPVACAFDPISQSCRKAGS